MDIRQHSLNLFSEIMRYFNLLEILLKDFVCATFVDNNYVCIKKMYTCLFLNVRFFLFMHAFPLTNSLNNTSS